MCGTNENCKGDGSCGKCQGHHVEETNCEWCMKDHTRICSMRCECECHDKDKNALPTYKFPSFEIQTGTGMSPCGSFRISETPDTYQYPVYPDHNLWKEIPVKPYEPSLPEQTSTRLLNKNWSPLIVRKYQMLGWPMWVSLICDVNLNDLDQVVNNTMRTAKSLFDLESIQGVRNACGYLSDMIIEHYNSFKQGSVEGVAVLWYTDKMFCSSLYGDYMTHAPCKDELYKIINTMPHI